MKISKEVQEALKANKAVVALESTIISHGMPYPKNVETALRVEKVIRDHGAIPATIGIIDGEPVIGMSPEEIEQFGKRKGVLKHLEEIYQLFMPRNCGVQQLLRQQ